MCDFITAWTPEIPNYGRPAGIMVPAKGGEPFGKTHMGNDKGIHTYELPYELYDYPPEPKTSSSYVSLKDHRVNVCDKAIGYQLKLFKPSYEEAAVFVQITLILTFFATRLLSLKRVLKPMHIDHNDLRDKRNFVVYWIELTFSLIALPFIATTLVEIFPSVESYDAVNPDTFRVVRGLITTQTFLYLIELFYRVEVRFSLMTHHLMTSAMVIFLNYMLYSTFTRLAMIYGLILILLAVTEQPLYVILILRLMGYRERYQKVWPTLCHTAATIFLASRVLVVTLLLITIVRNSSQGDIGWSVREESFVEWWNRGETLSPSLVTVVVSFLAVGILYSNYHAWAALNYMARIKEPKWEDQPYELPPSSSVFLVPREEEVEKHPETDGEAVE